MKRIYSVFFCLIFCTGMKKQIIKKENFSCLQDKLIYTLQKINKNNLHFLSENTFLDVEIKTFKKYNQLNKQRIDDLQKEECNPLTIPAMIILNRSLSEEYNKLTDKNNKHHKKHTDYLNQLKKLLPN